MSEYFYYTTPDHPLAEPLVTQLTAEYDRRYGEYFGESADKEMNRYPAALFAPPDGNFLLLLRDGFPIAGGAFKRFDHETAELKRIWTDENHRRQGLARRIVVELEQQAFQQGYTKLYLTTGFRQPEARELYLTAGYTPLFDVAADPEIYGALPFEKYLVAPPLGYVPTMVTPPEGGWKAARERQLAASPLPTSPTRGEVQIEVPAETAPQPPAGTSPLVGEVGRGVATRAAVAQHR